MTTGTLLGDRETLARDSRHMTRAERAAVVDALLDMRAYGTDIPDIAAALLLSKNFVRNSIHFARAQLDARALTQDQAQIVRRFASAPWEAAPAPMPQAKPDPVSFRRARSLQRAEECRGHAVTYYRHKHIAAHFAHLADLYEHHGPRLYPDVSVESDVVLPVRQPTPHNSHATNLASLLDQSAR